ncbi:Flotillin-like protein 6 [Camellia lanceoleosa]|uniref:Flotillin-like protein 6 n=1 Tax=Camellia lanceoleosa TaxID=1840588 RepID=A0ACC0HE08_9ERIC|nr:Flotillin-like protein 6 [Camellia lanceoleosa]
MKNKGTRGKLGALQQTESSRSNSVRERERSQAQKATAEAAFYALQQLTDRELYAKQKEVAGLVVLGQAQGVYICTLLDALGGNYNALRDYLMINGGMWRGGSWAAT